MSKKTLLLLGIVILLAIPLTTAFADEHEPWTGDPDPYDCNVYEDCYWMVTVCIEGKTYNVGIYYDPAEATAEEMEEDALGYGTELTIGACAPTKGLIFDGLYAYGNEAEEYADETCYIISTRGEPSVDRRIAVCEAGYNWPDDADRPGWVETSYLLNPNATAVYDDGSAWGWWEGDMIAGSLRLPLRHMEGYWSYLFKEFCHYTAEIGEPKGWCK